jgi:DNA-binding transcriptional ArsR family regulator
MMQQTRVEPLFQALADPARLAVVQLLSSGPKRAGQLADASGLPAAAMSKHLKVLLRAGLVSDERTPEDARARVFRLRTESVDALSAWLEQLRACWEQQLGSFKRHVERKP